MGFEKMMQKIVNAKIKTDLKLNIIMQDLDIHYSRGYCLYNNTAAKMQIQGITVQDSCPKKPKAKGIKPERVKWRSPQSKIVRTKIEKLGNKIIIIPESIKNKL